MKNLPEELLVPSMLSLQIIVQNYATNEYEGFTISKNAIAKEFSEKPHLVSDYFTDACDKEFLKYWTNLNDVKDRFEFICRYLFASFIQE